MNDQHGPDVPIGGPTHRLHGGEREPTNPIKSPFDVGGDIWGEVRTKGSDVIEVSFGNLGIHWLRREDVKFGDRKGDLTALTLTREAWRRIHQQDFLSPPPQRRYLPTLSDLVDRLTIVQQKMIFISERADEYRAERADILHDIDLILKDHPPLTARAIWAITLIQLTNRCIWESESKARAGGNEQDKLLKLTHSINGQRNTAKNVLAEEIGGSRMDYKVDALSAELPPEYGHWDIF